MKKEVSFQAKDYPLKDVLFSSLRFAIPRYQRPYAWTEDQLEEFWNDLVVDNGSVFLGSFILNKETLSSKGYVEVIDGQQRMLTMTIFVAVIRDMARSLDEDLCDLIQRQDIAHEDRDGNEQLRIVCGESTAPYFEKYIQQKTPANIHESAPKTQEEKRIRDAYLLLKSKASQYIDQYTNNSEKVRRLKQLRDRASNFTVIRIDIENEEDAYEIFETTNARGVDLSVADLLKNLIFKNVQIGEDRGDFAKEVWGNIVSNVEVTGTQMKRFIRYHWISMHSLVHDKQLFKAIKRNVTDWEHLLDDLWTASGNYRQLLGGVKEDWQDMKHGEKIFKAVAALQFMDVFQCHVLFMSILRNYTKLGTDPLRIFELIEKFSFSYSAICKLPANRLEKLYSQYGTKIEEAVSITHKKRRSAAIQQLFEKLTENLKELRPSLEVFRERFLDLSYRNSEKSRRLLKYVLGRIEEHGSTGEKNIDFDVVNIEHVLPQKPSEEWDLTRDDVKSYVNKLGNLTLVSKKFNSKAGNKGLKTKVKELAKTEVKITSDLVSHIKELNYSWGEEQINERQENLAQIAYNKVWNF